MVFIYSTVVSMLPICWYLFADFYIKNFRINLFAMYLVRSMYIYTYTYIHMYT